MDLTHTDIRHLQVTVVRQTDGTLKIELQDLADGRVILRVDPTVSQWMAAQMMMATTRTLRLVGSTPELAGDRPAGLSDDYGMTSGPGPAAATDQDGHRWVSDGAGGRRDAEAGQ